MTDSIWQEVRASAAAVVDVLSDVQRKGAWTADQARQEAQRLLEACNLPDETTALRALLEILLMRERFEISESLNPQAQFQLVEAMWLRNWTGDEVRAAIADVLDRFHLQPRTLHRAIQALLEIGYHYRSMLQPDRWPNGAARAACAELMWIAGVSENDAFTACRQALQRFELAKGHEHEALNALVEIELIYRRTAFDPALEEPERRRLAEIMWLRGWTMPQALEQAAAVRTALGTSGIPQLIDALHQICLRCGGQLIPNPFTQAVDLLMKDSIASSELRETLRTQLGEYRWLQGSSLAQAMEKVRRYASMTGTPPLDVFRAALEAARKSYRDREPSQEMEKP